MSDIRLPRIEPPAQEWRRISQAATFRDPFAGSSQVVSRAGDRWALRQLWESIDGAQRASLAAWLTDAQGPANQMRVFDWLRQTPRAGNWPEPGELFTAPGEIASWTVPATTGLTLAGDAIKMDRVTTGGADTVRLEQQVSLTASVFYVIRGWCRLGTGPNCHVQVGTTSGAQDVLTRVDLDPGDGKWFEQKFQASGSANWVAFVGEAYPDGPDIYSYWSDLSLSRCAEVLANDNSGKALKIWLRGWTGTQVELLSRGDLIELNGDLYELSIHADQLVNDLTLYLTTPLRTTPAQGDVITVYRPSAMMRLASGVAERSDTPGFSNFAVDMVEAL